MEMRNNLKNYLILKIPVDLIEAALRVAVKAKKDLLAIDEERRTKYPQDAETVTRLGGENALAEFRDFVDTCNERKVEITRKAQGEISDLWKKAVDFIDDETTPKGKDVVNEPDFALLDHGVVDAVQLARLIEKHSDNFAFLCAAELYAQRHGFDDWQDFAVITKERALREYIDQLFQNIGVAASHPSGPVCEQYTHTDGEYRRIAVAYGLTEEFDASHGERLDNVIKYLW